MLRPRRKDDGARSDLFARLTADARDASAVLRLLAQQFRYKKLTHIEVRRIFECFLHDALIEKFIRLHPERVDGGAFARIEEPPLDRRPVRRDAHLAAERIDLAHEMTLAGAADGRVAGHHRDVVERKRHAERTPPEPRRCERRLDTRVPRTDDDNVVICRMIHNSFQNFPVDSDKKKSVPADGYTHGKVKLARYVSFCYTYDKALSVTGRRSILAPNIQRG